MCFLGPNGPPRGFVAGREFKRRMTLEKRIAEIIGPTVEDMGFDLVRVLISGQQRRKLQIMAEPLDGRPMTVDDCADISRAISALLDVEDPIQGAYTLEVSSPGLDRPLVKPADFERFAGLEAKVEMDQQIDGRRRFSGRLLGFEDGNVRIEVDGSEMRLPFAGVLKSKLLLTDELIAAAEAAQADRADTDETADAEQDDRRNRA